MRRKQVMKVAKSHDNQVEFEEQVKQVKVDDEGERNNDGICHMDKLPNEILMKILRFLNNKALLKNRRVNSRWNEICCLLRLNRKTGLGIGFHGLRDGTFCTTIIRKPIEDFLKCFSPSEAKKSSGSDSGSGRLRRRRPIPLKCSDLDIQGLKYMDEMEICEFIYIVGAHLTSFSLVVNVGDVPNFPALWKVLLHFAPNIEHLKIKGNNLSLEQITLFDPVSKFISERDPEIKALNPKDTFLKNLKVLEFTTEFPYTISDLLEEILQYAPKMKEVNIHNPSLGYAYVNPLPEEEKILPWNVLVALRKANRLRTNKFDIKYEA